MPTLYLDLDGTLIDVSERYYRIYREIVLAIGGNPLEKSEYWRLKRQAVSESELLSQVTPLEGAIELLALRAKKLESAEYLKYDQLVPGALEAMKSLKTRAKLVLVTLRNVVTELRQQLQTLGLFSFFDQILSPDEHVDDHAMSKATLISASSEFRTQGSVIVGDSEADILAGKLLGIKSIAVLSGIRDREILARYSPEHIIESLAALPMLLSTISGNDLFNEIHID